MGCSQFLKKASDVHPLSGCRKRRVELRGVAFMTVLAVWTVLAVLQGLDGFGGSAGCLALLCLSYKIQDQEATVTVLAVSAVMAVSVMTAIPLNSTPLFRHPDPTVLRRRSTGFALHCTSKLYCNAFLPLDTTELERLTQLFMWIATPPICIAIVLRFAQQ